MAGYLQLVTIVYRILGVPHWVYGFALFSCVFQVGLAFLVALGVYGAITREWSGVKGLLLAPLLLVPALLVATCVTMGVDFIWFDLLHFPKPSQELYTAWAFALPVACLTIAVLRKPRIPNVQITNANG